MDVTAPSGKKLGFMYFPGTVLRSFTSFNSHLTSKSMRYHPHFTGERAEVPINECLKIRFQVE